MSTLAVAVLSPRGSPLDPVLDLSDPGINSGIAWGGAAPAPADNTNQSGPMIQSYRNWILVSDPNLPFSPRKRGPPESP